MSCQLVSGNKVVKKSFASDICYVCKRLAINETRVSTFVVDNNNGSHSLSIVYILCHRRQCLKKIKERIRSLPNQGLVSETVSYVVCSSCNFVASPNKTCKDCEVSVYCSKKCQQDNKIEHQKSCNQLLIDRRRTEISLLFLKKIGEIGVINNQLKLKSNIDLVSMDQETSYCTFCFSTNVVDSVDVSLIEPLRKEIKLFYCDSMRCKEDTKRLAQKSEAVL